MTLRAADRDLGSIQSMGYIHSVELSKAVKDTM